MQVPRLFLALLTVGQSLALTTPRITRRSPEPEIIAGKYLVDRETFANHASYTFTGSSLPAGLVASNYGVAGTHTFTTNNVIVRNGYLELLVNGGQNVMPYKSAQIETTVTNIKYASVRTIAILTEPAGVCNGMFFYKSDTQESDIEWLSDAASQSNQGTRKLWFTNQDANGDGHSTYFDIDPPSNPTSTEHEYRLDWTNGLVQWFVDGVLVAQTTTDVPSQAGPWLWNNWSNGDKGWSAGPPSQDAVFKVKSIDMYYNTA